jgi:phosphomevalonate kinase
LSVRVELSAPGKLVLLGEYAVLRGAPAVVMAVDRRARVELVPSGGELWSATAPPLAEDSLHFAVASDGSVRWLPGPPGAPRRLELLEHLLGAMAAAGLLDPTRLPPAAVTIDTRALFESGAGGLKLGLGSSAAATVALASALAEWAGRADLLTDPRRWLSSLIALHRALQGGSGSGVDLAASLLGGVVSYRLGAGGGIEAADPLPMPEGLEFAVVWTGEPADTGSMLRRLDERIAAGDAAVEAALERLAELSVAGSDSFRLGRVASLLATVNEFCNAMEALGRAAGLPIVSAEHDALRRIARRHGAAFKPSGAGGGDLALICSSDREAVLAAADAAAGSGFRVLSLGLDRAGLRRVTD